MNKIEEIKKLFEEYENTTDYEEHKLLQDIKNIALAREYREFVDEEDKERYLNLCEDVFALAEDFNREHHIEEALLLKNVFREITKTLDEEDKEELEESMNSRGL